MPEPQPKLDQQSRPKTVPEFIRQMKAKYLESEDLWWMTEQPEEVYRDLAMLIGELEHTYWKLDEIMGEA